MIKGRIINLSRGSAVSSVVLDVYVFFFFFLFFFSFFFYGSSFRCLNRRITFGFGNYITEGLYSAIKLYLPFFFSKMKKKIQLIQPWPDIIARWCMHFASKKKKTKILQIMTLNLNSGFDFRSWLLGKYPAVGHYINYWLLLQFCT